MRVTMSDHLFGMHDYHDDWANMVRAAGKQAWCVHTEAVGCDPRDTSGKAYPDGVTNIVRLNNGYGTTGTIPLPERYSDFAKRCANFVAASKNIQFVIVGNELALSWEWPEGQVITLANYMACYLKCYIAIKTIAPNVKVSPQAPAPWNNRTPDAQDWIEQLRLQLEMSRGNVDWIALHAYTKGYGPDKFANNPVMGAPYQHRKFGWESLYEYMSVIPYTYRQLPVIITECNADHTWADDHSGWIQQMYAELDKWNHTFGNQSVLGACMFRWARHDDKWDLSRHGNAVDDFRQALTHDYRHGFLRQAQETIPGSTQNQRYVNAEAGLNLRDMPNGNIIKLLPNGTPVEVSSDHGEWLCVIADNVRGFVFKEFVS